jgi:hypothetical protein
MRACGYPSADDRIRDPPTARGAETSQELRGDRDPHYLERYSMDGGRRPRELGQGMHEGGHTRRAYVPRHTRVGRDAPAKSPGARCPKSRPLRGSRSRVEAILDAHYLRRTTKLPVSVVAELEHAAAVTGTDGGRKLENNQTVPDAARDKYLKSLGGRTRTRTLDPLIKSQSLFL